MVTLWRQSAELQNVVISSPVEHSCCSPRARVRGKREGDCRQQHHCTRELKFPAVAIPNTVHSRWAYAVVLWLSKHCRIASSSILACEFWESTAARRFSAVRRDTTSQHLATTRVPCTRDHVKLDSEPAATRLRFAKRLSTSDVVPTAAYGNAECQYATWVHRSVQSTVCWLSAQLAAAGSIHAELFSSNRAKLYAGMAQWRCI